MLSKSSQTRSVHPVCFYLYKLLENASSVVSESKSAIAWDIVVLPSREERIADGHREHQSVPAPYPDW